MKTEVYNIYDSNRSPIPIAIFKKGFASDFFFEIPEAFQDALDIRLTEKTLNEDTRLVLTQGSNYNFQKGDIIYDKKEAYQQTWGNALNVIKHIVQVINSSPARDFLYKTTTIRSGIRKDSIENKISSKEKEVDEIQIFKYKYDPGSVDFVLSYIIDSKITNTRNVKTSQQNFIVFLQTGKLFDENTLVLNLNSHSI